MSHTCIEEYEIVLWGFDGRKGGVPIYSVPTDVDSLKYDFRLSSQIYRVWQNDDETANKFDWAIISIPIKRRALCYGCLIDKYWTVLSLNIPDSMEEWLLINARSIITQFKKFFELLLAKGDITPELKDILTTILEDVKESCQTTDSDSEN